MVYTRFLAWLPQASGAAPKWSGMYTDMKDDAHSLGITYFYDPRADSVKITLVNQAVREVYGAW